MDRMDDIDNKEMHLVSKSASSGRRKIPVGFYFKWIDLETFGPPSGSKAFEAISGPGRRTSGRNRLVRKGAKFL